MKVAQYNMRPAARTPYNLAMFALLLVVLLRSSVLVAARR